MMLVRSIFAAWERGDFDSLGWAHAEIEFVVADGAEPTQIRGLRAMLQYWREFLKAWDGSRIVAEEYRELDERRVLVLVHADGARAKASGLELGHRAGEAAQILDVDEGMVTRLVTYFNRGRALADLGLERELELTDRASAGSA
jgi:ketosteroid isomerase-like protein